MVSGFYISKKYLNLQMDPCSISYPLKTLENFHVFGSFQEVEKGTLVKYE